MWAKLAVFVELFKDFFFDNKEESNFKSDKFNTRKFTVFLTCLCLFSLSSLLLSWDWSLAHKAVRQEDIIICLYDTTSKAANEACVPETKENEFVLKAIKEHKKYEEAKAAAHVHTLPPIVVEQPKPVAVEPSVVKKQKHKKPIPTSAPADDTNTESK